LICWCGRQHKGFGWRNYGDPFDNEYRWFCSKQHLNLWIGSNKMIDPTKNEIKAMTYAGKMAGEYMAEIKKTDLAKFNQDEWMTLLKIIYGNTTAKIADLEIPF
tara:strand:- start:2357 stop:2668 length:312 start_codon:yes stop_codon:yes gene_type:complete